MADVEVEEYGYPEEEKKKSWLELILEYIKSKKEASQPKVEKVA